MKTLLTLMMALILSSSYCSAEPFSAIPHSLVKQYLGLKKLNSNQVKQQVFEVMFGELSALEKNLMTKPDAKRSYESLTIFELKEFFGNIKKQGFSTKGCETSLKLMPYWADPQLTDITDAGESARFSYEVVKEVCSKSKK